MKKNILLFGIIIIIIICAILLIDIDSKDDHKNELNGKKKIGTISLVIEVKTLIGKTDNIPNDGIIFTSNINIYEDDTAFTALQRICEQNEIALDYTGQPTTRYVKGISGIYELDYGPNSGWLYYINDEALKQSSGIYELNDQDVLRWSYSCEKGDISDASLQ